MILKCRAVEGGWKMFDNLHDVNWKYTEITTKQMRQLQDSSSTRWFDFISELDDKDKIRILMFHGKCSHRHNDWEHYYFQVDEKIPVFLLNDSGKTIERL